MIIVDYKLAHKDLINSKIFSIILSFINNDSDSNYGFKIASCYIIGELLKNRP